MADKVGECPISWPVLLGASFVSGLLVGYWLKGRNRYVVSEGEGDNESDFSYMSGGGEMKMVLVIRSDLKMGKGKIGAQCGHAVLGAYRQATLLKNGKRLVHMWEDYGQPKIALKVDSEEQLVQLHSEARNAGLNAHVVRDAGRTQIAPGSKTVLAIGPGPADVIDEITGHLKLL